MSDAREELSQFIRNIRINKIGTKLRGNWQPWVFDLIATEVISAGYAKPSPAAEAGLREALEKISAIRDSIVGFQSINWSEHIYPLVAALDAAGFKGACYEIARKNAGTLVEQINAAEARIVELEAALSTRPAGESAGVADLGPEEISYQVEQGEDGVVAEAHGPEDDARREALHYAAVYSQDGPVSLFRVSRREWCFDAARASRPSPVDGGEDGPV